METGRCLLLWGQPSLHSCPESHGETLSQTTTEQNKLCTRCCSRRLDLKQKIQCSIVLFFLQPLNPTAWGSQSSAWVTTWVTGEPQTEGGCVKPMCMRQGGLVCLGASLQFTQQRIKAFVQKPPQIYCSTLKSTISLRSITMQQH